MRPVDSDVDPGANPFALALAGMPEVWRSLLIDHEPDSYGRCTACRSANTPGVPWPCTLRVAAEDARDLVGRHDGGIDGGIAAPIEVGFDSGSDDRFDAGDIPVPADPTLAAS